MKLILIDDDGAVLYGTPLTITVSESTEPYLVEPDEWVKSTLTDNWDTSFIDTPRIIYPYERKALDKQDLIKVIEIKEGKVETEAHGQGQYKTNRYPIEITCRSEGLESSKGDAKKLMAHTKELIETYWNNIQADGLDFVEFLPDDAQNMSVEMAGKFEWRWNIKIVGTLRGRAGTPQEPNPIGGELMEVVAVLPAVADARVGIFYMLDVGSGTRNKIYYKDKDSSDAYTMMEICRPFNSIIISNFDGDTDVATGDGVLFATIPFWLDGYELIGATASVDTAGATAGTTDIVIRRSRLAVDADMLSVPITLSVGEYTASDGTVDTANDDVNTGDRLFVDVDAVNGTAPKGLSVVLTFYNSG